MDILYIVIPAYNEEANIARTLREWHRVLKKTAPGEGASRLVAVDDGSKDRTGELLEELAKELPELVVLHKENGGHGSAVLAGYRYALLNGADYIFQTDSDGQTVPGEFRSFWKRRKEYDFVIGWRENREDGSSRIFVTKVLRVVVRFILGVRVLDPNTPFRLMKREALSDCMTYLPEECRLPNADLSAIAKRTGHSVRFLCITFRPRQGGVNSINPTKIAGIGLEAIGEFRGIDRVLRENGK